MAAMTPENLALLRKIAATLVYYPVDRSEAARLGHLHRCEMVHRTGHSRFDGWRLSTAGRAVLADREKRDRLSASAQAQRHKQIDMALDD